MKDIQAEAPLRGFLPLGLVTMKAVSVRGWDVKLVPPGEGRGNLPLPLKLKLHIPILFLGIFPTNVLSLTHTLTCVHTHAHTLERCL